MKEDPFSPENVIAGLLALAAERRQPRRRSLKEIEHWRRVWCANRRRRQIVATNRSIARKRERNRRPGQYGRPMPFGQSIVHRMAAAMEPGCWYGGKDLARLIGAGRSESGKVVQVMWPRGIVRRAVNPAYAGSVAPQRAALGEAVPRFVYQLTEYGLALREAVLMLE